MCKILFGTLIAVLVLGGIASADDQAAAKAILDEAIKADGGEAALGKVVGMHLTFKGTEYDGDNKLPLSEEWFFERDNKMRAVSFDENNKINSIDVVNGKEGWKKEGDQATENLSSDELESHSDDIFLTWATMFVPLKAEAFRLSTLDDTSVAGRTAVGILMTHDKHKPLKLYFDKETHLLVKSQRKVKNVDTGKDVDEESLYSDYRTVSETKQPFKIEALWDGVKVADEVVMEMKFADKPLDEKLFAKP